MPEFKHPQGFSEDATITINGVVNPDLAMLSVLYSEPVEGPPDSPGGFGPGKDVGDRPRPVCFEVRLRGGPVWRYRAAEYSIDYSDESGEIVNVNLEGAELIPEFATASGEYRQPRDRIVTPAQTAEIARLNTTVDRFARRMKMRLAEKVEEGYTGWDDWSYEAPMADKLWEIIGETNDVNFRGREVDIANFAMFLYFLHFREEAGHVE